MSFTFTNANAMKSWLRSKKIKNNSQFKRAIGSQIVMEVNNKFDASQTANGVNWLPLKVRVGKPLIDTGALKRSIAFKFNGYNIDIGTDIPYASIHQYGRPEEKIPQRAFFPTIRKGWPDKWKEIIANNLSDLINKYNV